VLGSDIGKETSVLLPDGTALSYTLDSRYFILALAGRAIGLCFCTYDHTNKFIYGNYIAVQECWRGGDIAHAFFIEVMTIAEELFPQCQGLLFEVERFDKIRIETIIEHVEKFGAFESVDDRNEIRKFLRTAWYQKMGCLFFCDNKVKEPLVCTSPSLDPEGGREHWQRMEEDYWIMWYRKPGTPLDIGKANALWVQAVKCIYIEILAKSLVELSPDSGQEYWRYANEIVDRTLKDSEAKEITFCRFLYRHDSPLLRRWSKLGISVAI